MMWVKEREFAAIVQFTSTVRSTFDRRRFRKSTCERGLAHLASTGSQRGDFHARF